MASRYRKALDEFGAMLGIGWDTERSARLAGWLQNRDPRFKAVAALALLITVGLVRSPATLAALYAICLVVTASSRLSVTRLMRRAWIAAAVFTGLIALPAVLNVFTPGPTAVQLPLGWAVTTTGLTTAARLLLRALTSLHVLWLVVYTTPWNRVLAALGSLGAPAPAVVTLGITHRYAFLLTRMAGEMMASRSARTVGHIDGARNRTQIANAAGTLLLHSHHSATAVHGAMIARGFTGRFRSLEPFRASWRDVALVVLALALSFAAWSFDRHAF